jgi:hypothetical protein
MEHRTGRASRPSGDKRNAPRYPLRVPVAVLDWARSLEAVTRDISASGVRVEGVDVELLPGTRVIVALRLPPEGKLLEIPGVVTRETESGGFAVRFVDPDPELRDELSALLPQALALASSS